MLYWYSALEKMAIETYVAKLGGFPRNETITVYILLHTSYRLTTVFYYNLIMSLHEDGCVKVINYVVASLSEEVRSGNKHR